MASKTGLNISEVSQKAQISLNKKQDYFVAKIGNQNHILTVWRKKAGENAYRASLTLEEWQQRAEELNTIYEECLQNNPNYQALENGKSGGFFLTGGRIYHQKAFNTDELSYISTSTIPKVHTIFNRWKSTLPSDEDIVELDTVVQQPEDRAAGAKPINPREETIGNPHQTTTTTTETESTEDPINEKPVEIEARREVDDFLE